MIYPIAPITPINRRIGPISPIGPIGPISPSEKSRHSSFSAGCLFFVLGQMGRIGPMGPISCDGSYGPYGIDHDGSNRFDGIDFDNGAKPVGTASFGLDLRCGLLPNECPNEILPVRIFHFALHILTVFLICATM